MKIKIKTKQQQCFLKLKIKNVLKITIRYEKKMEKLMGKDFNTKPTYGDDENEDNITTYKII